MEIALLNYFVLDNDLHATCDFNPYVLEKGVSIYEVLRVEEQAPIFLQEHIDRFFSSAKLENITVNLSGTFIRKAVKLLIQQNRMHLGNIKFLYHHNGRDKGQFMAWVMPFFYPSVSYYINGVVTESMRAERENPNAKKSLYNLREQADKLIKSRHLQEVVYVNARDEITEGSRSNIFFVRGQHLVTPKLSLVLPGITRSKVIQLADSMGVMLDETIVWVSQIEEFDVCFLTGTSPKLLPVRQLDSLTFDVKNQLMRKLMLGYDEIMAEDKRRFSW